LNKKINDLNLDYELKETDSNEIIKELYIEHEKN
jgi:hypothetical protein